MPSEKEKNDLTVAIYMITYNHEKYIKSAVKGVMNQIATFRYKLFLGEDLSSDKTREICINLAKEFEDKIELFLPEKNLGIHSPDGINLQIFQKCIKSKAKYIALCEGDDQWTDPYKLQKQVEILEMNQQVSMCTHEVHHQKFIRDRKDDLRRAASIFYHDLILYGFSQFIQLLNLYLFNKEEFYNQKRTHDKIRRKKFNYLDDFIDGTWYMAACSIITKSKVIEQLLYCLKNSHGGHQTLLLLGAINGGIYHMKDVMAVKRDQESSITMDQKKREKNRAIESKPESSNVLKRYESVKYFASEDQKKLIDQMIEKYKLKMGY